MARILVIDDNASVCEAVCEMLRLAGHEALSSGDGRNASQIHNDRPIDLLITDIFMPETDGLEVIFQFRRKFPEVKIIAISGGGSRGMTELLSVAEKMGAKHTLMKPFAWADLLNAVHDLVPQAPIQ